MPAEPLLHCYFSSCHICSFLFPDCALKLWVVYPLRTRKRFRGDHKVWRGSFHDGLSQSKIALLSKRTIPLPMASDCNFLLFISSNTKCSHAESHISLLTQRKTSGFWRVSFQYKPSYNHTLTNASTTSRQGWREGQDHPFLHAGHRLA